MKTKNIFDDQPKIYQLTNTMILTAKYRKALIAGGRSTGKTMNSIVNLVIQFLAVYPEGDIIILRDFKQLHLEGAFKKIKTKIEEYSKIFPAFSKFIFDEKNITIFRTHVDQSVQRIHFLGVKNNGIAKAKSSINYEKYISAVFVDEAEENDMELDYEEQLEKRRKYIDFENTVSRRDKLKYKDYPQTVFIYVFNPQTESGVFDNELDEYAPTNEPQLLEMGFNLNVVPEYENNNGLLILRSNLMVLLRDEKRFHPSKADLNAFNHMKKHDYEMWRYIWMGLRKVSEKNIFGHYAERINNTITNEFIITDIGIDSGLIDNTTFVAMGQNYDKLKRDMISEAFPVYERVYSGKDSMSLYEKEKHVNNIAAKIAEHIIDIVKSEENFKYYYDNNLSVNSGHKDTSLLIAIKNIIKTKYPIYFEMIRFREIKEVTGTYNIENRINYERRALENGLVIINKELTPNIYSIYKKYSWDIIKNKHDKKNDLMDAYFYAKYYILKKGTKNYE